MITVSEIQKLISSYLHGTDDLESFGAKFAVLSYDIEKNGEPAAIQLSYEIESGLGAITAGLSSEEYFKTLMQSLSPMNCVVTIYVSSLTQVYLESLNQSVEVGTGSSAHAGIPPSDGVSGHQLFF